MAFLQLIELENVIIQNVGNTKRHFLVRMFEHLGISLTTGKNYTFNPKNNNNTAVLNHINCNNCDATLDNFCIIGSARND